MANLRKIRSLFGSIATYSVISQQYGVQWLRRTFQEILEPYSAIGAPETHLICWRSISQPDDVRIGEIGEETWGELLRCEALRYVEVRPGPNVPMKEGLWPFAIGLSLGLDIYGTDVRLLEFSIRDLRSGSHVSMELQRTCVQHLTTTFEEVDGVFGMLTWDHIGALGLGTESPYERYSGWTFQYASRNYQSIARGYYWGTILNAQQCGVLGGPAVMRSAPVLRARGLSNGGWFLQVTEDINTVSSDDLQPLKQFMQPILPPFRNTSIECQANSPRYLL